MLPSSASYLLPDTLGRAQSFSVYSLPHSKMPTAFKPVPGSHPPQLKHDPWSEEGKRVSATLTHSSSWWLPGSYKKRWDAAGVRDVTSYVSDFAGLWPLALSSQQFLHTVPSRNSFRCSQETLHVWTVFLASVNLALEHLSHIQTLDALCSRHPVRCLSHPSWPRASLILPPTLRWALFRVCFSNTNQLTQSPPPHHHHQSPPLSGCHTLGHHPPARITPVPGTRPQ